MLRQPSRLRTSHSLRSPRRKLKKKRRSPSESRALAANLVYGQNRLTPLEQNKALVKVMQDAAEQLLEMPLSVAQLQAELNKSFSPEKASVTVGQKKTTAAGAIAATLKSLPAARAAAAVATADVNKSGLGAATPPVNKQGAVVSSSATSAVAQVASEVAVAPSEAVAPKVVVATQEAPAPGAVAPTTSVDGQVRDKVSPPETLEAALIMLSGTKAKAKVILDDVPEAATMWQNANQMASKEKVRFSNDSWPTYVRALAKWDKKQEQKKQREARHTMAQAKSALNSPPHFMLPTQATKKAKRAAAATPYLYGEPDPAPLPPKKPRSPYSIFKDRMNKTLQSLKGPVPISKPASSVHELGPDIAERSKTTVRTPPVLRPAVGIGARSKLTGRTPPVATGQGRASRATPGDVMSLGSLPSSPKPASPNAETPSKRRTSENSRGSSQFEEEYPTPAEQRNSARRKEFAWQGPRTDAAYVANPFVDRVSYKIHGAPPPYLGNVQDPQSEGREDAEPDPVKFYGQPERVQAQIGNWPVYEPSVESVQLLVPAVAARDPDRDPGGPEPSSSDDEGTTTSSSGGSRADSLSVTPTPPGTVSIGHSSNLRRLRDLLDMNFQLQQPDFEDDEDAIDDDFQMPLHMLRNQPGLENARGIAPMDGGAGGAGAGGGGGGLPPFIPPNPVPPVGGAAGGAGGGRPPRRDGAREAFVPCIGSEEDPDSDDDERPVDPAAPLPARARVKRWNKKCKTYRKWKLLRIILAEVRMCHRQLQDVIGNRPHSPHTTIERCAKNLTAALGEYTTTMFSYLAELPEPDVQPAVTAHTNDLKNHETRSGGHSG